MRQYACAVPQLENSNAAAAKLKDRHVQTACPCCQNRSSFLATSHLMTSGPSTSGLNVVLIGKRIEVVIHDLEKRDSSEVSPALLLNPQAWLRQAPNVHTCRQLRITKTSRCLIDSQGPYILHSLGSETDMSW